MDLHPQARRLPWGMRFAIGGAPSGLETSMSTQTILALGLRGCLTAVATLVAAMPWAGSAAAAAVALAPHRAIYDVKLDRVQAGAGVADLTGRMVYELTGSACEGYTQNMRFVTRMTSQEGAGQVNDLRSSSWEEATGKRFRFNSSQYRDEQLAETTQGDAERREQSVKVDLAKPKKKDVALSTQVYFPIQHSIAIIEAARAGKSLFIADLYDGSEKGEKVYATTSAIGKLMVPGSAKSPVSLKNGEKLDVLPSWPVSISYFDPGSDKKDALPTYELSFRFYENGVSTRLVIDYGEFSIRGELKELTFLDPGKCEPPKR